MAAPSRAYSRLLRHPLRLQPGACCSLFSRVPTASAIPIGCSSSKLARSIASFQALSPAAHRHAHRQSTRCHDLQRQQQHHRQACFSTSTSNRSDADAAATAKDLHVTTAPPEPASGNAQQTAGLEPPDYLSEGELHVFEKLKRELQPSKLEVQDVSGGCGSMYALDIVSSKFKGLGVVHQHKLVNQILKDELKIWHGMQLKTKAA